MREFASRYGRATVDMSVTVRTDGESFPASAANIGMGGLFVATEHPFAVGARLTLELMLREHAQPVEVVGEVRWVLERDGHAAGMGVRFVDLPVAATVSIYSLLQELDAAGRAPPPGRSGRS
jgi:uncharacterized protein (TIGR02266 family)